MKISKWGLSLVAALLVLSSGWVWHVKAAESQELQTMLTLSSKVMTDHPKVIMIHRDEYLLYDGEQQFLEMSRELSDQLELPFSEAELSNNHYPSYYTEFVAEDGAIVSLRLAGTGKGQKTYYIIKLQAESEKAIPIITKTQTIINDRLASLGSKPDWNVMVQGTAQASDKGDFESLLEVLHDELNVRELDRYTDRNTVSISYYTSKLQSAIYSGKDKMNLQVALHKDSITKKWRITMGIPIVTVEY